jgi:AraC-like DNA-binding protein
MREPTTDPLSAAHRPHGAALLFRTDQFAERERVAAWREFVGRSMLKLDIAPVPDSDFHAEVKLHALPGVAAISGRLTPVRIDRTRSLIDSDDLILCVSRWGELQTTLRQREAVIASGDAVLMNADDVGSMIMPTGARSLALRLPRDAIAPAVATLDEAMCRRIPAATPALRLLSAYLGILDDADASASTDLRHQAAAHVRDLVALTVGATRDAAEIAMQRGVRAARLRAIKQDIADNLHGDLSIAALCARHGCTPRQLQRLFEREGTTLTAYVLEQRLACVYRLLADPRRAGEKISALAFAAGFHDLSHFARAFRRRYGMTPSDLRARRDAPN